MTVEVSERPTASHSNRAVMRQSGLTGVAAAAGVIAGLVLDISIAFRFGAGENTDAFFVASRIPLGIAAVVMAAANQALVPAFRTSLTKRGDQHTNRFISMVVCVVLAVGVLITLAAWLGAGPLIRATAPGISAQEVSLAASMVPVMFAMVPLVALAEVLRAYLNASYAFVAPALMTVVLNGLAAVVILAGPMLLGLHHKDIHLVAYAFLSGAVAQAVFMWAMAVRRGLHFQPAIDLRDKELRGIGSLSIRPLAASGLNPVARVGEQLIVSFLPTGSITILNYGYMVVSAVGGTVFFRSVIVALLPRLTDAYNRDGSRRCAPFHGARHAGHARHQPATHRVHGGARGPSGARRSFIAAASTRQARNCSAPCWPCTRSAWWGRRCSERCSHHSLHGSIRARRCEPRSTASSRTWCCCRCWCCRSASTTRARSSAWPWRSHWPSTSTSGTPGITCRARTAHPGAGCSDSRSGWWSRRASVPP